jgi:hypothetical protein
VAQIYAQTLENGEQMATKIPKANENDLQTADRAVHDWYRFVLSFPPHLVREYLQRFGASSGGVVLDPFCGTGTTVVECKKLGITVKGIEANPMAYFASAVKTNWQPLSASLIELAEHIAQETQDELAGQGIDDVLLFRALDEITLRTLPAEAQVLLLEGSIDPLPLHKTLVLLEKLNRHRTSPCYDHLRLALAHSTVRDVSNLHFGPEVGVRGHNPFASVILPWLKAVRKIAGDLEEFHNRSEADSVVIMADSRQAGTLLQPNSVSVVITSPPYPNEKDYSRTTRLESVLLGFLTNRQKLQALKRTFIRSNTRTVYKGDDDEKWIAHHPRINELADLIESRRVDLGKTSGFEKLYARVTKLYFGGMAQHLASLRHVLQPGALLAYVVGDQASYFQVLIRTGSILAEIAEDLGYRCENIDLFRTRLATATGAQLREEVVVLRWNGKK